MIFSRFWLLSRQTEQLYPGITHKASDREQAYKCV